MNIKYLVNCGNFGEPNERIISVWVRHGKNVRLPPLRLTGRQVGLCKFFQRFLLGLLLVTYNLCKQLCPFHNNPSTSIVYVGKERIY